MAAARLFVFGLLVALSLAADDGIPRQAGSSTELLGLGGTSTSKFTGAAAAGLPTIGNGPVSGVHFSRYSDPEWDSAYMGVRANPPAGHALFSSALSVCSLSKPTTLHLCTSCTVVLCSAAPGCCAAEC
jgi:hypothetical protein